MTNPTVNVGSFTLEVSPGHIYMSPTLPRTYDFLPWNVIGRVLDEADLADYCLIDIGANVGDSLAHFRCFSSAPAICIEPSDNFFAILERNAAQFDAVTLHKALVAPDGLVGNVTYSENDQTGSSRPGAAGTAVYGGDYVTLGTLLAHGHGKTFLKTDTDGFDADILNALLGTANFVPAEVPLIFFEGPDKKQMQGQPLEDWIALLGRLQDLGYGLLLLTNRGYPVGYADTSPVVIRSIMNALATGMANGFAFCHYLDVIAVHETMGATVHRLERPWTTDEGIVP